MPYQKIRIEQSNRANHSVLFVANRERLATATGVIFIDTSRMIAMHLVGQSMHLLEYDSNDFSSKQIDCIDTVFNGEPTISDLLDFDGSETVLASNFRACSGTLYKVNGNKLVHFRDLPLPEGSGRCHGARFYDQRTACLTTDANKLFFIDVSSAEVVTEIDTPFYIKDLCFVDDQIVVAAFALGAPNHQEASSYASGLLYLSLNVARSELIVIDTIFLRPCAFDAICIDKNTGRLYVTDQFGDRLIVAEVRDKKLAIVGEIGGFNFPHGIGIDGNTMAVTNYGDSTVSILNIKDAKPLVFRGKVSKQKPYRKGDLKRWIKRSIK